MQQNSLRQFQNPNLQQNNEQFQQVLPQYQNIDQQDYNKQYQQNQILNDTYQQEQQTTPNEDFVLMDVVGGGCTSQNFQICQETVELSSQSISVHHPTKPIVAYTSGCMIIIYDLLTDQKVNLMGHKHNVYALSFTPNGENLMSVDFDRDAEIYNSNLFNNDSELPQLPSCIYLWDWKKGECIQTKFISRDSSINEALIINQAISSQNNINEGKKDFSLSNLKSTLGCYIQICFDKQSTSTFMILQSSQHEVGGGYRITIWNFNKQNYFEMIGSMDLELQNPCIDISFLLKSQIDIINAQKIAMQQNNTAQIFLHSKIQFMTAEKQCIKLWEYSQGNAKLTKRIHIKQQIVQVLIAELTNFFLILGENGKLLILDQQGEFISTISKDGILFTKICFANDKLLLGTNRGTIQVFHLASLQFINEVPYQLSFLEKFSLNSINKNLNELEQLSLQKVGPPVMEIGINQNLRFLFVRYTDGSFALIDRTISTPRQAILGYSCGHFERISGMQWIPEKSPLDLISKQGGFYNVQNRFQQQDKIKTSKLQEQQFITCSHDLSIHIWRHYGDRWAFSYIDVAKCFDQSLTFQRKQCDRSTREMKLTAISLFPKSNNIIVGDNKGIVRVFQLVNQNSHLIQTHKLVRSQQLSEEKIFGFTRDSIFQQEFKNDLIKDIYISQNETVAVITFSQGNISFYDIKNGFQYLGDVLDQDQQKLNMQFQSNTIIQVYAKFIENDQKNQKLNILDKIQLYQQTQNRQQDEQPFQTSSERMNLMTQNKYNQQNIHETVIRVLFIENPNSMALQLVDIQGSKIQRQKLCQYVISDGRIEDFDIHPSKDYILVTSNKGRIYVFRIDTGELRGTIKIPMNSSGCLIDPSGLYVVIKVPAYNTQNIYNLQSQEKQIANINRIGLFASNLKTFERNTVLMFEVGTGQPAAEISSIFEISQMKFSNDGRYLSLGSSNGSVSVWSMGSHLLKNVSEIIQAMKLQNDFWFNYPIFLPDYEQLNQVQNLIFKQQDFVNPNIIIKPQSYPAKQSQYQTLSQDEEELQDINQRDFNNALQQQPYQQQQFMNDNRQKQYNQIQPAQQFEQQYNQIERTPQKQNVQYNYPVYQNQAYPPTQNNSSFSQNPPLTLQGNQQRFLRNQQIEPFPRQPSKNEQENQFQIQEMIKSQRQMNNQLYKGISLPPQYPPYAQQSQSGKFYPNPNTNNRQQFNQNRIQSGSPYQDIQQYNQNPPQGFEDYMQMQQIPNYQGQHQSPQGPQFQQNNQMPQKQNNQNNFVYPGQQISGKINPYQKSQPTIIPSDQYGGYKQNIQQQYDSEILEQRRQFINEQEKASAILLKHKSQIIPNQNQTIDLKEPLPYNQSQLLYDKPVPQVENTLRKTFERYADFQAPDMTSDNRYENQNTPQTQLSKMKTYIAKNQLLQRTNYDMSLNDRDILIQQTQPQPQKKEDYLSQQFQYLHSEQNKIQNQSPIVQTQQKSFERRIETEIGKKIGFSNTQSQNDILLQQTLNQKSNSKNQLIQQDPEDIDKEDDQDENPNPIPQIKNPPLNNYLQNVRIPQAIQEKDQFNKIPKLNINKPMHLDQTKLKQTLNESSDNSKQKISSTYDIIDEVYQDIDDFEFRLSDNFKNKQKYI